MQKLLWNRNGSQLNLSIDMNKSVDVEQRTVIGFATLDNVDYSDDIVSSEASLKAFANFRGNVRFQHNKERPVGKVVDFYPATYWDEATQKEYSGIKVAVRVSLGAEDVWQMCLDGTISGFSIGGAVIKASSVYSEDLKRNVQVIEEYVLTELSLVDSPANGLANVLSIYKALDSDDAIEKGYATEQLYWCAFDRLAHKSSDASSSCPKCGEDMANMGHVEKNESVQTQLEKVLSGLEVNMKGDNLQMKDTTVKIEKDAEGSESASVDETAAAIESVVEETEEVVTETDEVEEDSAEDEVIAEAEAVVEDSVEDAVDEVVNDDTIARLVTELKDAIQESNSAIAKDQSDLRLEVTEKLTEIAKDMESKFEGLEQKYKSLDDRTTEFKEKLKEANDSLTETKKMLESYASGTAMKKSRDAVLEKEVSEAKPQSTFEGLFSGHYAND